MNFPVKIRKALVSVYHKEHIESIIRELVMLDVELITTGGTQNFIEMLGESVTTVEGLTSYPSILGGRVKTLHPKILGGILARRDNADDLEQMKDYQIPAIDFVFVDLYPFEDTVASGANETDVIEKIDIGGISLTILIKTSSLIPDNSSKRFTIKSLPMLISSLISCSSSKFRTGSSDGM